MSLNKIKVIITGSKSQLAKSLFKNCPKSIKIISYKKKSLNIENYKQVYKKINLIKPNVLINCAAYTDVNLAEKEFNKAKSVNYKGIKNIAKVLKKKNILLVHFSSDYIFNGRKKTCYLENDKMNPISKYGLSKSYADKVIVKELQNYLIFRISWLYGEYKKNFLTKFINISKKTDELNIIHDNFGRPTNSHFFSNFIWTAIKKTLKNKKLCGIYNYSDNGSITNWYQIVEFIYKKMKKQGYNVPKIKKILHCNYISKATRPKNSCLNINKVQLSFDFTINNWKYNLNKTLKQIIK